MVHDSEHARATLKQARANATPGWGQMAIVRCRNAREKIDLLERALLDPAQREFAARRYHSLRSQIERMESTVREITTRKNPNEDRDVFSLLGDFMVACAAPIDVESEACVRT